MVAQFAGPLLDYMSVYQLAVVEDVVSAFDA